MKLHPTLTLVAVSLVLTLNPTFAHATSIEIPVETRTLTWTSLDTQPVFEEIILIDGVEYTLADTPEIQETTPDAQSVPADFTDIKECKPADLEATLNSFPQTHVSENSTHKGEIPLINTTYEEVWATHTFEVNANQTHRNLSSNDANQIPQTLIHTSEQTGNTLELTLAGLSWEAFDTDADGFPDSYTAYATYRGTDSAYVLDHYIVTATYAGEIPVKENITTYTATLEYLGPIPVGEPEQDNSFPWGLIGGVVVAALAATGGIIILCALKNARVCEVLEDGTLKCKKRLRATKGKDGRVLVIPSNINMETGKWAVVLNKHIVNALPIKVTWSGKTLYDGVTQERIYL